MTESNTGRSGRLYNLPCGNEFYHLQFFPPTRSFQLNSLFEKSQRIKSSFKSFHCVGEQQSYATSIVPTFSKKQTDQIIKR